MKIVLRALLHHYAPFFLQQGGYPEIWGNRLLELADADAITFACYLQNGDQALQYDARGLKKPWRTFFRYDNERFCGTVFDGDRWPVQLSGIQRDDTPGKFYWGVWEPIIEALRDGRLNDIAKMQVIAGETQDRGRVFVLQSDGVALAWAPGAMALDPGLFDDLFPATKQSDAENRQISVISGSGASS